MNPHADEELLCPLEDQLVFAPSLDLQLVLELLLVSGDGSRACNRADDTCSHGTILGLEVVPLARTRTMAMSMTCVSRVSSLVAVALPCWCSLVWAAAPPW